MERWWDPQVRVGVFLRAYFDVLVHDRVRPWHHSSEPVAAHRGITSLVPPYVIASATPRRDACVPMRPTPSPLPEHRQVVRARRAAVPHMPARFARTESAWRNDAPIGRPITALHGCHRGREIWVLGCGPSLMQFTRGDAGEGVTIGVNFAFEHAGSLDYHTVHAAEVFDAIRGAVDAARLVLPETLVAAGTRSRIAPRLPDAYIYPLQNPFERDPRRKHLSTASDARMLTWFSAAYSAIHLAAYMGAARIRLQRFTFRSSGLGRRAQHPVSPAQSQ